MDDDVNRRSFPSTMVPRPSDPVDSSRDVAGEEFLFHLYRGSELLQDSRVHEAKEELEHALLLQPRDPKGQDLLGVVYFRLGLYPRAIQIYEQLKVQNPQELSLRINLALCYLKTGQAQAARLELEDVVRAMPDHRRAWGYLGLAFERLGDSEKAEEAFERGGHAAMARRVAEKRAASLLPRGVPGAEALEIRAAVAKSFQDLDAGELSLTLAEPAQRRIGESGTWRAIEPSAAVKAVTSTDPPRHIREPTISERPPDMPLPPPPRSTPPRSPAFSSTPPGLADPLPPPKPRFSTPPPPRGDSPRSVSIPQAPPVPSAAAVPPTRAPSALALPAFSEVARAARVHPSDAAMVLDPTGLLSLRLLHGGLDHAPARDFAVRLEALRAYTGDLTATVLGRRGRTSAQGEPFGGLTGALVRLGGEGLVVLGPRPSRHLTACSLRDEVVFLREDVVVAFDLAVSYENGRLMRGDDEPIPIVQLKGAGEVAFELGEPLRSLEVVPTRPAAARVHTVVGWIGRLIPRVLPPSEAPGGQKGLVSFAGDGALLLSGR